MSHNELDDFKKYVNLPSVAEDLGFTLDKKKSSISTLVMNHPFKNEQIHIFTNAQTKDQLFRNIHNEKQKGTIIDLVQLIKPQLNLGEVRKYLRPFLNQPPIKNQYTQKPTYLNLKDDGTFTFFKLQKLTNTDYLNSRGISNETLEHPNFLNTVGQVDIHSTKYNKTFNNTAFPIKNKDGIVGLDVRNKSKEGSFKHSAAGSKRSLGLWTSNIPKTQPIHFLIVESPIDAFSHHQLNEAPNNYFYISTNGTPSPTHINLINKAANKLEPETIQLGNDNDNAGIRFNINYLSQFNNFRNQSSVQKNWELKLSGNHFLTLDLSIDIPPSFNSSDNKDYTQFLKHNIDQINSDAHPSQIIAYEKPLRLEVKTDQPNKKHYQIHLRNNLETLKELQTLMVQISNNPNVQINAPKKDDFNKDLQNHKSKQKSKSKKIDFKLAF